MAVTRSTITSSDGATAQILAATDGDILVLQNQSDAPLEWSWGPLDKNDPAKRGFILYPAQEKVITGTLSRRPYYFTHSSAGGKVLAFERTSSS